MIDLIPYRNNPSLAYNQLHNRTVRIQAAVVELINFFQITITLFLVRLHQRQTFLLQLSLVLFLRLLQLLLAFFDFLPHALLRLVQLLVHLLVEAGDFVLALFFGGHDLRLHAFIGDLEELLDLLLVRLLRLLHAIFAGGDLVGQLAFGVLAQILQLDLLLLQVGLALLLQCVQLSVHVLGQLVQLGLLDALLFGDGGFHGLHVIFRQLLHVFLGLLRQFLDVTVVLVLGFLHGNFKGFHLLLGLLDGRVQFLLFLQRLLVERVDTMHLLQEGHIRFLLFLDESLHDLFDARTTRVRTILR
mmetsp:Transcript_9823/g.27784  ORF Transcript_9823/g.27784 Transcript_9823/m.27784 type:complete len:301 (-) Transcript_9823:2-904(-)